MAEVQVGFAVRREAYEPAPPSNAAMSVIGTSLPVTPAADATQADIDAAFPLDEPVLFGSTSAKARLIHPDSYLGKGLSLINAQGALYQTSAQIVLSRVEEGVDTEATIANIVGNSASRTGMHALKYAGSEVGAIPRLYGFPGFTAWRADANSANPIAAALPEILNAVLGIAVVDSDGTDRDGDVAYRETIASERILPVTPSVFMTDSNGDRITRPASPSALGLFVRRDFEHDGRPFKSILNQPVYGIEGPSRAIEFSLVDGATEGQDLLSHQVSSIIRGESGNDFAIADGGFVFMGYEGTGADEIWRQIHKVRGRDFLELTAIRTLRNYLGKWNLTTQTIQAVVNTIQNIIDIAKAKNELLDGIARFDPDENNPSDLRSGHIYVDMHAEEAAVFRKATLLSRPYATALDTTIESLLASSLVA